MTCGIEFLTKMVEGINLFLRTNLKDEGLKWTVVDAVETDTEDTLLCVRSALVSPRFLKNRKIETEYLILCPDSEGKYIYRGRPYYSPYTLFEKVPLSHNKKKDKQDEKGKRLDLAELYVAPGYYLHIALSLRKMLWSLWDPDKNAYADLSDKETEIYSDFLSANLSTVPLRKKYYPWDDDPEKPKNKRTRWIQVIPLLPFQPLNALHGKSLLNQVIYHGTRMSESMRWPHPSHIGILDLFESPESEEMGRVLTKVPEAAYIPEELRISAALLKKEEPQSIMSWATRSVPFANYSDGPRVMMGGKNLKQAIQVVGGELPIIRAGTEETLGMRWGVNAFVGYALFKGLNFEDGIVASESFAKKMAIESEEVFSEETAFPCPQKYRINFDETRNAIILSGQEEQARRQVRVELSFKRTGQIIARNDSFCSIRVYYLEKNKEAVEVRNRRKAIVYKERYPAELLLDLKNPEHRRQILFFLEREYPIAKAKGAKTPNTDSFHDSLVRVRIPILARKPLEVGDKITGRHGNKGTISAILPDSSMPYVLQNGERKPLDLILSPFGIITRMNLGQLLETQFSFTGESNGKGFSDIDPEKTLSTIKHLGYEAEPGDSFGRIRLHMEEGAFPATVGYQYFVRLDHCVRDKLHVISKSRINANTFQPYKGRANDGGQRLGEMEFWTLFNHGATELIDLFSKTNLDDWKDKKKYIARMNEILNHYHRYTISPVVEQGKMRADIQNGEKSKVLEALLREEVKKPEEASALYRIIMRDIRKQCSRKLLTSKEGYIRKCMLGRRVHYSGRATITPATDISIDQVKLPIEFALEWNLLAGHASDNSHFGQEDIKRALSGDREKREELCSLVNTGLPAHLHVLLNRQPSLHRHSMAAFRPFFWEEYSIGLPIMVCEGFGADFDGDTMAVYYPITQNENPKMQEELKGMAPSRHPFRSGNLDLAYSLSQDLAFGFWRIHGNTKIQAEVKDLLATIQEEEIPRRLLELQTKWLLASTKQNVSLSFLEAVRSEGHLTDIKKSKARGKEVHFEKLGHKENERTFGSGHTVESYLGILPNGSAGSDSDFDNRIAVQTRRSMIDKKFHVGEGGYFTRKLVELLYPVRVIEADCGNESGLIFPRRDLNELIGQIQLEKPRQSRLSTEQTKKENEEANCLLKGFLYAKLFLNRFVRCGNGDWFLVNETNIESLKEMDEDIVMRSPVSCQSGDGNLCARCLGYDPSKVNKPFRAGDYVGVLAGHTIGERGTQLSMKTFQTGDFGFRMQRVSSYFLNVREDPGSERAGYFEYFKNICLASIESVMRGEPKNRGKIGGEATADRKKEVSLLQTIDVLSLYLEILYREMIRLNLKSEAEALAYLTDWRKRGFFTALSFENPRGAYGDNSEEERKKAKKVAKIAEEYGKEPQNVFESSPKALYAFCLGREEIEHGSR